MRIDTFLCTWYVILISFSSISKAYVDKCNTQIAEIVEVVRGKLPAGARMTIGALIVIDVHGNVSLITTTAVFAKGSHFRRTSIHPS